MPDHDDGDSEVGLAIAALLTQRGGQVATAPTPPTRTVTTMGGQSSESTETLKSVPQQRPEGRSLRVSTGRRNRCRIRQAGQRPTATATGGAGNPAPPVSPAGETDQQLELLVRRRLAAALSGSPASSSPVPTHIMSAIDTAVPTIGSSCSASYSLVTQTFLVLSATIPTIPDRSLHPKQGRQHPSPCPHISSHISLRDNGIIRHKIIANWTNQDNLIGMRAIQIAYA